MNDREQAESAEQLARVRARPIARRGLATIVATAASLINNAGRTAYEQEVYDKQLAEHRERKHTARKRVASKPAVARNAGSALSREQRRLRGQPVAEKCALVRSQRLVEALRRERETITLRPLAPGEFHPRSDYNGNVEADDVAQLAEQATPASPVDGA